MGCNCSSYSNNTEYYSQKYSSAKPNETDVFRARDSIFELTTSPPNQITLQDVFLQSVQKFSQKKLSGTRLKNNYFWKTYKDCENLAKALGSSIINFNLAPKVKEYKNYELFLFAVFSKNRYEWLICDLASYLFGFTIVPILDTMDPQEIKLVLRELSIQTIFCSMDGINMLMEINEIENIKTIVSFEEKLDNNIFEFFTEKKNITLMTFSDLLRKGVDALQPYPLITPETIFTICYTSGTTSFPKPVMISHKNFTSMLAGVSIRFPLKETDIHMSYLPLSHIFERCNIAIMIYFGAAIGFYNGDAEKIKDDILVLKPTIFVSTPRIFNKIFNSFMDKINKLTQNKRNSVKNAIFTKFQNLKNGEYKSFLNDKLIFDKFKIFLGGNIRIMISTSGYLDDEVASFMKIVNGCPLLQSFGSTETTGYTFIQNFNDSSAGNVGGPWSNIEFKLVQVFEDKKVDKDAFEEIGFVEGEICLKGPALFVDYYKLPGLYDKLVDEEGWYHTNVLGRLQENGSIAILDRKENYIKNNIGKEYY